MKKVLFFLAILFMLNPFNAIAQRASRIVPVNVYWLADGKQIDLKTAQSGIRKPNRLELVVVLNADNSLRGQKFEFKWYQRGPTRDYLTNSFVKKVVLQPNQNKIILKAGRENLKKGWWKVQVNAYIDRRYLSYANTQVFWVNIL